MRAVIQRVSQASVSIDGNELSAIGAGFLILLGVVQGDGQHEAERLASKIAYLRVFADESGKMNRSLIDTCGDALVVSNFTLCASCAHGRRPSFIQAAGPEESNILYEYFAACLHDFDIGKVEMGRFGADMQISLCNDGPVTIILDTDEIG